MIAHAQALSLGDAEFVVSASGRARVLRERQKNVHAGVRGQFLDWAPIDLALSSQWALRKHHAELEGKPITYNPYRHETFVDKRTGVGVYREPFCLLIGRVAYGIDVRP